jgi:hypothetical protein
MGIERREVMQNIIVDKLNVRILKEAMNKCFIKAIATGKGTYGELEASGLSLERGRGIFISLEQLGLLTAAESEAAKHDIKRIEDKQVEVRREKEAEIYARHMQKKGGNT